MGISLVSSWSLMVFPRTRYQSHIFSTFFTNSLDKGIKCTLHKIADNTKLGEIDNMLMGRKAFQRDLDRQDQWTKYMTFNNVKLKALGYNCT